jgi:glucosylceramidase
LSEQGFEKNVDLWAVAHSSAFVPEGSVRLNTRTENDNVVATAFMNPYGSISVIAHTTYYDDVYDLTITVNGVNYFIPSVARESSISLKVK